MTGRLAIVGLGPGPAEWMTAEASAAIADATDLVGYAPYLERLTLEGRTSARTRATIAWSSPAPASR